MKSNPQALFRQEVLQARADTRIGKALQIRPVGATRLTLFFVAMAVLVLALLIGGSYTRKERVQGAVQARDGVAAVVLPDAGVVTRVLVQEGQIVQAGDVLAEISHERYTDAGSTQALLESNLDGQRQQVLAQAEARGAAHQATLAALSQRIEQAQRDARSLSEEVRLQEQQVASTRRMLDQLKPLAAERIVSDVQYEQQRQVMLEQTARLHTLTRQRSTALAEAAQASEERARLQAEFRAAQASLDRDLLGLQNEAVQRRGARQTVLKAPVGGVVSGLLATPGQSVAAQVPILSIVPASTALTAVLYVPSTAIGFVKPGQPVRVSYDAFPYQRFGQYRGVVHSVSHSDVPAAASPDRQDRRAYFMVRIALDAATVKAYGAEVPLRPGHTLTADIEIERRRLISWMLDPLTSFTGKL